MRGVLTVSAGSALLFDSGGVAQKVRVFADLLHLLGMLHFHCTFSSNDGTSDGSLG